MKTTQTSTKETKLTRTQQNALHLFCGLLADELKLNGLGMRQTMEVLKNYDAMPTKHLIKELIWRPVQIVLTGKQSTTELLKQKEIDAIYETLCKAFGEMGITIPAFPSFENQSFNQTYGKPIITS